ncbi:MAG: T9SS type A sorting domain-containing protein, partial [Rhodothermales bacterium]|nr:T9SS type A sorting domain-containing protein [Rhodothermales bacterium]
VYTFKIAGQRAYFEAEADGAGYELHVSDGTAAGTRVIDLDPGPGSSFPTDFHELGDGVAFLARTAATGSELWFSDGTPTGTVLLADALPGSLSGRAQVLGVRDGLLYYCAEDYEHGMEMWVTDGTPAGTRLLYDLVPGPLSAAPEHGVMLGDRLFVGAWQPETGNALHSINLETGDLRVEADLHLTGTASSGPRDFVGDGHLAGFLAIDGETGSRAWLSDGTAQGTYPIPGSSPRLGRNWDLSLSGGMAHWRSNKGVWSHNVGTGVTVGIELDRVDEIIATADVIAAQSGSMVEVLDPQTLSRLATFEGDRVAVGNEGLVFAIQNDRVVTWSLGEGMGDGGQLPPDQHVGRDGLAHGSSYYFMTTDSTSTHWLWQSDGHDVVRVGSAPISCCILRPIPVPGGILLAQGSRMLLVRGASAEVVADAVRYSDSYVTESARTWFTARSNSGEASLWSSTGTKEGTREIHRLPGDGYAAAALGMWQGHVVLALEVGELSQQFYLADESRLWAVGRPFRAHDTDDAVVVGSKVLFPGQDSEAGREVWSIDLAEAVGRADEPEAPVFSMDIWPNPAKDWITVDTPPAVTLEVFDMLGRQVGRWESPAGREPLRIPVSGWPTGTYALRIKSGSLAGVRMVSILR